MHKVTTECDGKTPQIITGDVLDLDTAAHYAVNGIYGNQGEVCNAGSRLIVDATIHDEFVSKPAPPPSATHFNLSYIIALFLTQSAYRSRQRGQDCAKSVAFVQKRSAADKGCP